MAYLNVKSPKEEQITKELNVNIQALLTVSEFSSQCNP